MLYAPVKTSANGSKDEAQGGITNRTLQCSGEACYIQRLHRVSISLAKLVHELLARVPVRVIGLRFEILFGVREKLLTESGNGYRTVDVGKKGLLREKRFELLFGLPLVPLSLGERVAFSANVAAPSAFTLVPPCFWLTCHLKNLLLES